MMGGVLSSGTCLAGGLGLPQRSHAGGQRFSPHMWRPEPKVSVRRTAPSQAPPMGGSCSGVFLSVCLSAAVLLVASPWTRTRLSSFCSTSLSDHLHLHTESHAGPAVRTSTYGFWGDTAQPTTRASPSSGHSVGALVLWDLPRAQSRAVEGPGVPGSQVPIVSYTCACFLHMPAMAHICSHTNAHTCAHICSTQHTHHAHAHMHTLTQCTHAHTHTCNAQHTCTHTTHSAHMHKQHTRTHMQYTYTHSTHAHTHTHSIHIAHMHTQHAHAHSTHSHTQHTCTHSHMHTCSTHTAHTTHAQHTHATHTVTCMHTQSHAQYAAHTQHTA